jgi:hypothetical protein
VLPQETFHQAASLEARQLLKELVHAKEAQPVVLMGEERPEHAQPRGNAEKVDPWRPP